MSWLGLLVLAVLATSGCASAPRRSDAGVKLTLSLDAEHYRIGEAVTAALLIQNKTDAPLVIPGLDNSTLTFYWGEYGTAERRRHWPVLPDNARSEVRLVAPEGSVARRFVFTRLTSKPGKYGLIAALSNCVSDDKETQVSQPFYGPPVSFEVTGEVLFERDPQSGIITKEQAVTLARSWAQAGENARAKAVLVPLEDSGLVTWVVFISGENESPSAARAFSVNPYTCVVKPLDVAEASEAEGVKQ